MTIYAVWDQPFFMDPLTNVQCRMTFEDVVKWQRHREPRYETDEQAFDDFLVVHWATKVEES